MSFSNEYEPPESASGDAEPTLNQAEPYRSPTDVAAADGSGAGKKALMASPLGWGLLAFGLIAGGAVAFGMLTQTVEEFGLNRAGPPQNIRQHVEDVPMIRSGVPEPEIEEPVVQQPVVQSAVAVPEGAEAVPVP